MKIKTEKKVKISANQLKHIIKYYFRETKSIQIKEVEFEVSNHYRDGDWRAEYSMIPKLDRVICKGKEIK